MELFTKTNAVKLRSHLDKYLVAGDDNESVRQSRHGGGRRAIWTVELVDGKNDGVLLKSCYGRYLTASDDAFLLGMTGKRVIQTWPEKLTEWQIQWEPVRDGFQVRMKTWCGKYLRANGGTPPWRNSVTHDDPYAGATQKWILWDVEPVDPPQSGWSVGGSISPVSSLSSGLDEVAGSEPGSPLTASKSPRFNSRIEYCDWSPKLSSKKVFRSGMDFFHNAKLVRLRSHHDKYLVAEEDEVSVTQDRNGSSKSARWTVEFVPNHDSVIRLKSCHNRYLTASNQPFLLGMTGRKVLQTLPRRLDSSVEWEPVREGNQVKLKTRYGHFLRANGGLPPWRNSVTHDIPHRTATQDWVLWDVDVIEIQVHQSPQAAAPTISHSESMDFESSSPSSLSGKSGKFSRLESNDSFAGSPPKSDGRTIYYHIADDSGEVDDEATEGFCFTFKGNGVEELTRKLEEEISIDGIIVCTRSPLNGNLFPLRLQLPPNNATMHVIVVPPSSKLAREFSRQGITTL